MYYASPWKCAFPTSNSILIGDSPKNGSEEPDEDFGPGSGLDGITRVKYPLKLIDEVDLWVFPDVYFSEEQMILERLGKRVWGAREGEKLELYRPWSKQLLKNLGLPVGKYEIVYGMDALRDYLVEHEDVWIKVSFTRGDMETWHSMNYRLSKPKLDELQFTLGEKSSIMEFVVEDAINDAVEIGFDGFCVDGKFSNTSTFGFEIKDLGYIGRVCEYDDLPEPIKLVNEKLSGWLASQRYRGFFSTELRITKDGTPYLIDPCARAGSPPSECYQEIYGNWAEIMWEGAEGNLVEPEPVAMFEAESMIHSSWADKHWQAIDFPKDIAQWIKLRNHCKIGGQSFCVPQSTGLPEVGATIGIGNSLESAIHHCQENAEQVHGFFIDIKMSAIHDALEEIRRGQEEFGIQFSEKLPEDIEVSTPSSD